MALTATCNSLKTPRVTKRAKIMLPSAHENCTSMTPGQKTLTKPHDHRQTEYHHFVIWSIQLTQLRLHLKGSRQQHTKCINKKITRFKHDQKPSAHIRTHRFANKMAQACKKRLEVAEHSLNLNAEEVINEI